MVPGRGVRERLLPLRARLSAARIDRQLAAGTPSWESPLYAVRARQLTDERMRRSLAGALDRIVDAGLEGRGRIGMTAAVTPRPAAVAEARPLLLLLAARLRSAAPVTARGVALLRDLLTDGSSPLYTGSGPISLTARLSAIDELLDIVD